MIIDRKIGDYLAFGNKKQTEEWCDTYDIGTVVGGYRKNRKWTENFKGKNFEREALVDIQIWDLEASVNGEGEVVSSNLAFDTNGFAVCAKQSVYAISFSTENFSRWYGADSIEDALSFAEKLYKANENLVR